MKFKSILLTLLLAIGLIGPTFAGPYDDWTDDVVCMWLDMRPTNEGYKAEVQKRGIGCEGGKAIAASAKTATTSKSTSSTRDKASNVDSDITIYDVVFSPAVLNELLGRIVSKTDYNFSKHKLAKNIKEYNCSFTLSRVVYDKSILGEIEKWNMAEGDITIKGSDVEFVKSKWRMGGLSTDPSYLRDEVNLKLTEDGHLVGKMAYFNLSVKQGEVPRTPLYVTLTKHKNSRPVDLGNMSGKFDKNLGNYAELWIDVEDWAGGVMWFWKCYEPLQPAIDLNVIKVSNASDGKYAFKLFSDPINTAKHQIGSGYFEIKDGIITVATEDRVLINSANKFVTNKYYNNFKGRIDNNGTIQANFVYNPCGFGSKCYVQEDQGKYKPAADDDKTIPFVGNIKKLKLKGEFLVGGGPDIVKMLFELRPKE
jgi:hypothetical protein